jgi:hypothetical protein
LNRRREAKTAIRSGSRLWPDHLSGGPVVRIEKDVPPVLDLEDPDLEAPWVPMLVELQMFERELQVGSAERVADGVPLGRDRTAGRLLQRRQDRARRRVALHAEGRPPVPGSAARERLRRKESERQQRTDYYTPSTIHLVE